MSQLRIEGLAKRFGGNAVVRDVSFEAPEGALLALLGPSGSGKTTLLRLVAGFEQADAGRILLDGDDVTTRSPLQRRCGMVFQHYALFPHLTVGANVAYGLAGRGSRGERAARVAAVLEMVDLAGFESRPVVELSGGQQQRVALARALAPQPRVLLLDEPLSNLDPSLRERTRRELRELLRRAGITTLLVTHEQDEAFDLADQVAVLHHGRLEQIGTPEALYQTPATPFVAGFVGRMSRLHGTVRSSHGDRVSVVAAGAEWHARAAAPLDGEVTLLVRPEGARVVPDGPVVGTVVRRRFAGATAYLVVALDDGDELEVAAAPDGPRAGARIHLAPTGDGAHAWPRE